MAARPDRLDAGRPYPLGAHWDGLGVNFAVFSAHAERIEVCIFNASGRKEIRRFTLPECTDEVWHGYLPGAQPGLVYGLRAHGPYEPEHGHRFNSHKLLLDPYARKLLGSISWSDALYGFRAGHPRADLSFDRRDSAAAMPKAVVVDEGFTWGDERRPETPWQDTVIYEAHLRGLTIGRDSIPVRQRGTFAGLADPDMIEHFLRLGVSAVELLPVHAFIQDRFLVEKGLRNYWGYSTLGFFAPEPAFLSNNSLREMKAAVRRLHAAGIEVILDVVYNHTAEGSELGPTLSWRGLDNRSYYRLQDNDPRYYVNDTGCGNTVNLQHPRVLQMVMDSLRHWVTTYHIDGFRFDLGTVLGRERGGFDPNGGFFDAIRQDPVLSRVKLISEPWDLGPGGYQLGNHPPGFAEWNDRFRDDVRRYWRGDSNMRPGIATRLTASSELFDHRRRRPWATVNYAASHDGFTLRDAVSYEQRHNLANGENNRDGHGNNHSRNWGVEGETGDPAILEVRARVQRALLATVFFSAGTPMLLAGDEMNRTQRGNNNAYCQDNATSWVDWGEAATPRAQALTGFVARLRRLRRRWAPLHPDRFPHGVTEPAPGFRDTAWFGRDGLPLQPDDWQRGEEQCLCLRRVEAVPASVPAGGQKDAQAEAQAVLILLNPSGSDRRFTLPSAKPLPALPWQLLLDTAAPQERERFLTAGEYEVMVPAHSLVLLGARIPEMSLSAQPAPAREAQQWGARLLPDGQHARFRLWAPSEEAVALELDGRDIPMDREAEGWFSAETEARRGSRYRFAVGNDLRVPDPASRYQPDDVHGVSELTDSNSYRWQNTGWRGRPWHETVLYELHPGTCGGFDGIRAMLPRLKELGITAVELMPINEFPGARNWGYDGVLPYAPDAAYGTPDALKQLIDEAHGLGLSVFLDVVYNHFGPDGAYLHAYAKTFFDEGQHTPWGAAIDFKKPAVQSFFEENTLYWLQEFRFDGLRFDAVHAISEQGWLRKLAARVRAEVTDRHVHLVLENEGNTASLLRAEPDQPLFDAQWNDDGHNVLHPLLTGEKDSYYEDFAEDGAKKLARVLSDGFLFQGEMMPHLGKRRGEPSKQLPPTAFVLFLQNHDQVGNRAFGERLPALADPAALRAATALLLLAPQIPMLFMGEEWAASAPFLFFTDFQTQELADAVREGRRKEFAKFAAFQDPEKRERIPDPNAESTFTASIPDLSEAERGEHAVMLRLHRDLLAIRHAEIIPRLVGAASLGAEPVGPKAVTARYRLGDGTTLTLATNLSAEPATVTANGATTLFESNPGDAAALAAGSLPAHSTVALLDLPENSGP